MDENMSSLKARAARWPDPWGREARELIRDAHRDLVMCQRRYHRSEVEDLRTSLLLLEGDMLTPEVVNELLLPSEPPPRDYLALADAFLKATKEANNEPDIGSEVGPQVGETLGETRRGHEGSDYGRGPLHRIPRHPR